MATAKRVTKWNPAHHPRDARGRFTKSATRVLKSSDATRARAALAGFRPVDLGPGAGNGADWLAKQAAAGAAADDAVARYFAGGWKTTHAELRTKKDAASDPDVIAIDKAMTPLSEDVMVERRVDLRMFAHIPMEQLKGMKVRDAAYQPTALQGSQGEAPDGMVTVHMAVPAGTRAIINPTTGGIVLDRDTETAISRVEPNGRGGYDMYGVVIPRQGATTPGRPAGEPDAQGGTGPDAGAPGAPKTTAPAAADGAPGDDTAGGSAAAGGPAKKAAAKKAAPAAPEGAQGAGDGTPAEGSTPAAKPAKKAAPSTAGRRPAPANRRRKADAEPATAPAGNDHAAQAAEEAATTAAAAQVAAAGADHEAATGRPAPTKVSDLERNDHVRIAGDTGADGRRTVTGYVSTPQQVGDRTMVAVTQWPDGQGDRTILTVDPDAAVYAAAPDPDPNVVLWKRKINGTPVNRVTQPDIVRGEVVRDPEREANVRARIAELHGQPAPAAGADVDNPGGKLGEMSPVDRAALAVHVEDAGPGIFQSPLVGGSFSSVGRYVGEGRDSNDLVEKYGSSTVWGAAEQWARAHPEVMARTFTEVAERKKARTAEAEARFQDAVTASEAGDFPGAFAAIDAGELVDPTHKVNFRGWDDARAILARIEAKRAAGAPAPEAPSAPDTSTAGPGVPDVPNVPDGNAQAAGDTTAAATTPAAPAGPQMGTVPADLVPREKRPEYRKDYLRGWQAAKTNNPKNGLEQADLRNEAPAWYDAWGDYVADEEKFFTARRSDAEEADQANGDQPYLLQPATIDPDTGEATPGGPNEDAQGLNSLNFLLKANGVDELPVGAADARGQVSTGNGRGFVYGPPDGKGGVLAPGQQRDQSAPAGTAQPPDGVAPTGTSPLGEDLTQPPPAPPGPADRLDPEVAQPTRDKWDGHGRPARILWFGDGTKPKKRGEIAVLTQRGTGKSASIDVRGEGDSELLRRQSIGDRMWLAPIDAPAAPAAGDQVDAPDSTAGTSTPGVPDGPTAQVGDRLPDNAAELLQHPETSPSGYHETADKLTWPAELSTPRVAATENIGGQEVAIVQYAIVSKRDIDAPADLSYSDQFYAVPADARMRPLALSFHTRDGYYGQPGDGRAAAGVSTNTATPVGKYRNMHIASGKTANAALSGARASIEKDRNRERFTPDALANVDVHSQADFDALDPNATIEPGDLVVLKSFNKLRTGVATKVTANKVDALVSTPSGAYETWYGTAQKGIGVRLLTARGINAPAGPAPAAATVPDVNAPPSLLDVPAVPDVPAIPAAAAPIVAGSVNNTPLTFNNWGGASTGPVHFHPDGEIGRAVDILGPDARLDVDGLPLAEQLNRLATRGARVEITVQDQIGELRALEARLPDGPGKRAVRTAADDLDAPAAPVPDLPAGTPPALQQLMGELWAVPMIRRDGANAPEIAGLQKVAARASRGASGARLADMVRSEVLNRRHESKEGKTEIDFAARRAMGSLERPAPAVPDVSTAGPSAPDDAELARRLVASGIAQPGQAGTVTPPPASPPVAQINAERRDLIADSMAGAQAAQLAEAVDTAVDAAAPADPVDARAAALEAKRAELAAAIKARDGYEFTPYGSQRTKSAGVRLDAGLRRTAENHRKVDQLEREVAALERPPAPTAPKGGFTPDQLKNARVIKTRLGWHEVVKVNAKSVKVKAAPGMDDLVPVKRIIDARDTDGKRVDAPNVDAEPIAAPTVTDQGAPAPSITAGADPFALVAGKGADDPFAAATAAPAAPAPAAPAVDVDKVAVDDQVRVAGQWATVTAKVDGQVRVRFPDDRLSLVAPSDIRGHKPAQRVEDMFGGTSTFVPQDRSTIGVATRADVGRTRGAAAVQQVSMFDVADQVQHKDQGALLDSFMQMPTAEAPVTVPTLEADAPEPTRVTVPDDIDTWTDEQLGGLFAEVSAQAEYDEAATLRIMDVWERRESEMNALVASVPDDLGTLSHDDVATLLVNLTATHGSMDDATVARVEADLERREQEFIAGQADLDAKRALLAKDPQQHETWEQLGEALTAAADLGDEQANDRIIAEMGRREAAEHAAAATAAAAAADAEAARIREEAQIADVRAAEAAQVAATDQVEQKVQGLLAARAAGYMGVGAFGQISRGDAATAAHVLGDDETRRVLGGTPVADATPEQKERLLIRAGLAAGAEEFKDWSDKRLFDQQTAMVFRNGGPDFDRARAQRASAEHSRRKLARLVKDNESSMGSLTASLLHYDVTKLQDRELEAAPAMLATYDGPDAGDLVPGRLAEIRGEVDRRIQAASDKAAREAAGPSGPVKVADPVGALADVERWVEGDIGRWGVEGVAARQRFERAKKIVLGLPQDTYYAEVNKAWKQDPRPLNERSATLLAWYRHFGQIEGRDSKDFGVADWMVGPADEPDLPDVPTPLPPADVAKAADVWSQLGVQARTDANNGDYSGLIRWDMAKIRAYGIAQPKPADTSEKSWRAMGGERWYYKAAGADKRTDSQRKAAFIAEFRRLAEEDGVDPADAARYGPLDRSAIKKVRVAGVWREVSPITEAKIDALVASGRDWTDAYAEVYQLDPAALRREEADAAIRAVTPGAKTLTAAYREYYNDITHQAYLNAEEGTRGHLLNAAGKKQADAGKLSPIELFSGTSSNAYRYASEELLRWWAENPPPRMSFSEFKADLQGDSTVRAALLQKEKGNEFA